MVWGFLTTPRALVGLYAYMEAQAGCVAAYPPPVQYTVGRRNEKNLGRE